MRFKTLCVLTALAIEIATAGCNNDAKRSSVASAAKPHAAALAGTPKVEAASDEPQKLDTRPGDFMHHPVNVWVKQSPSADAGRPPAPRPLQYEGGMVYDPFTRKLIHHGGHEGIYQTERLFTYDLATGQWQQRFPNTSPPGACCLNNNGPAFDIANRRMVRFPAGSLGHGFQFSRSIYMKESPSSVWTYDPAANTWMAMRPEPYGRSGPGSRDWSIGGLCHESAYDPLHEVIVHLPNNGRDTTVFTYDVYANALDLHKVTQGAPSLRGACGAVYDSKNARLVVFGNGMGSDPKTYLFDLKTQTWTGLELSPHPPTQAEGDVNYSGHPVMAYDSLNDVMLCVTWHPNSGEHETWALDTAPTPKWTKMNPPAEPEKGASRARNLAYSAEHNVFILELALPKGQNQVLTFRYKTPTPDKRPAPPTALEVLTDSGKATLKWAASATPGDKEYRVYRAEADKAWQAEYGDKPLGATKDLTFTDARLAAGKTYFYRVSAVNGDGLESKLSISARTQPRVLLKPVVSVLAKDRIAVNWNVHPAKDIAGYNVYRGLVTVKAVKQGKPELWRDNDPEYPEPLVCHVTGITGIVKLNGAPLAGTAFVDARADLAAKGPESGDYKYAVYAYIVRAVNKLGTESGPSPYALTIPSEPTNVLVRNTGGGQWELKWDINTEKGITGYRVYMTQGSAKQLALTPTADPPIKATTFAGKGEGRLWVTAVDALGQEGQPSSPANVNPSYKGFYEGEWHQ